MTLIIEITILILLLVIGSRYFAKLKYLILFDDKLGITIILILIVILLILRIIEAVKRISGNKKKNESIIKAEKTAQKIQKEIDIEQNRKIKEIEKELEAMKNLMNKDNQRK